MQEHFLDCRGLQCPLPIVRVSLAMKSLSVSEGLRVQATDSAFQADVAAWVRRLGYRLGRGRHSGSLHAIATCNLR